MPSYTARHRKSGKEQAFFATISEMEQWEKDNPQWEVLCGAPIPGYNIYSVRPTGRLKEQVAEMKKKIHGNKLHEYD